MLRLTEPSLSSNDSAANFSASASYVEVAKQFILERIALINTDSLDGAEEYINDIAEKWEELAKQNPDTLVYFKRNQEGICNLLISGEQGFVLDFPATLNSLRNVEQSSNVFIQERD
jgi:ABC-type Fe3+-hydroxamate transport system substrate-binding protein